MNSRFLSLCRYARWYAGFRFLLVLFCVLALASCGRTAKLPILNAGATVLAFGDSLTFGTGVSPPESYPAILQTLIPHKVVSAGVPGEISEDGLRRLPTVLDEVQPKLLVLCHGGNDFLRKLDMTKAAANVRAMVQLAQSRGISVVLIATPQPGLTVSPPDFYADIAHDLKVPIDTGVLSEVLRDRDLKSDLVHPNAKGYRLIAEAIAKLLKKSGAVV
ncbi:MAG: arylesterase [Betaproteobacteria bacterium]|nr:arylesterase [Betaproteobacteria bacterium]